MQGQVSSKRGSAIIVYFMIGVLTFLVALALAAPTQEITNSDNVMGADGLDCSNESITNQDKAVCISIDIIPPIYTAILFGLGAMLVTRILS